MSALARIDPFAPADLEPAIAIDLVSFVKGELGAGAEDPHESRARSLTEELVRPWARLRAARDGEGRLLGYTLFWHVVDELHLLNIAVTIEARRQGIGAALMNDLFAYANEHEAVRVLLEVRAGNTPAIRLYERLGFQRFNVRERYYSDGEDAVEMDWRPRGG